MLSTTQKRIIKTWIDALRGKGRRKYRQIRGHLYGGSSASGDGSLCCAMGVLAAELAESHELKQNLDFQIYKDSQNLLVAKNGDSSQVLGGSLPGFMLDAAGITRLKVQDEVISQNDTYEHSFSEIADYLEQYIEQEHGWRPTCGASNQQTNPEDSQ